MYIIMFGQLTYKSVEHVRTYVCMYVIHGQSLSKLAVQLRVTTSVNCNRPLLKFSAVSQLV